MTRHFNSNIAAYSNVDSYIDEYANIDTYLTSDSYVNTLTPPHRRYCFPMISYVRFLTDQNGRKTSVIRGDAPTLYDSVHF